MRPYTHPKPGLRNPLAGLTLKLYNRGLYYWAWPDLANNSGLRDYRWTWRNGGFVGTSCGYYCQEPPPYEQE